MSRFQLPSDAQWSLIADLLPVPTGKQGRPFRDARQVVEGIIYRYRCGSHGATFPRYSARGR
jgi:transposase